MLTDGRWTVDLVGQRVGHETARGMTWRYRQRMVGYLAGLNPPCEVLDPPELRRALHDHAIAVTRVNK